MKTFKFLLITLVMLTFSFNGMTQNPYSSYNQNSYSSGYQNQGMMNTSSNIPGWTKRAIKDPQGNITAHISLPNNWTLGAEGISGPGGLKIVDYQGMIMAPPQRVFQSVDELINGELRRALLQYGNQIVNVIELPQVAKMDEYVGSQLYQAVPNQKRYAAKAIEYQDDQGLKGMVLVHFYLAQSAYGSMSCHQVSVLETQAGNYEVSKANYLKALSTIQMNPQFIAMHNQQEQQKAQMRNNAYSQRRYNNQQAFEQTQRIRQQTNDEINQMMMDSYNQRSASSDRMNTEFINTIREVETMNNPYGNGPMEVQSGYKYYYVNQNGQYFGTNNPNYNPNTDPNRNSTQWRVMQTPPNGGY